MAGDDWDKSEHRKRATRRSLEDDWGRLERHRRTTKKLSKFVKGWSRGNRIIARERLKWCWRSSVQHRPLALKDGRNVTWENERKRYQKRLSEDSSKEKSLKSFDMKDPSRGKHKTYYLWPEKPMILNSDTM
ncbi:unnamed protein product [Ilex paraguariensis]|uniref:Uncharacterized protein n=1 Tax=Ilex paraguariensis TaxID=185542 RepID=A0ABC8R5L2_9AQUA